MTIFALIQILLDSSTINLYETYSIAAITWLTIKSIATIEYSKKKKRNFLINIYELI